jgi:hypothetical protein
MVVDSGIGGKRWKCGSQECTAENNQIGNRILDQKPRLPTRKPEPASAFDFTVMQTFHLPLAVSLGCLKGVGDALMAGHLPALSPLGTVLNNPVGQCPLEANVASRFLGFNPLVFEDFLPFCLEFTVQRRVLQQVTRREGLFRFVRHN